MKKFIVIAMLMLNMVSFAQVEVKGHTIGDRFKGEITVEDGKPYGFVEMTLGGITGTGVYALLNDDTIARFLFIPTDGEKEKRLYKSDVDKLKKGFENKYKITYFDQSEGENDITYVALEGELSYYILGESNQFMTPPLKVGFMIINDAIASILEYEDQERANNDF